MPSYYLEFHGLVPEFSDKIVSADDEEQAKMFALEEIRDEYPEMSDITFTKVEEHV